MPIADSAEIHKAALTKCGVIDNFGYYMDEVWIDGFKSTSKLPIFSDFKSGNIWLNLDAVKHGSWRHLLASWNLEKGGIVKERNIRVGLEYGTKLINRDFYRVKTVVYRENTTEIYYYDHKGKACFCEFPAWRVVMIEDIPPTREVQTSTQDILPEALEETPQKEVVEDRREGVSIMEAAGASISTLQKQLRLKDDKLSELRENLAYARTQLTLKDEKLASNRVEYDRGAKKIDDLIQVIDAANERIEEQDKKLSEIDEAMEAAHATTIKQYEEARGKLDRLGTYLRFTFTDAYERHQQNVEFTVIDLLDRATGFDSK